MFLSSAKPPLGLPAYLDTKIEAENFVREECKHLDLTSIRPGFIYNMEYRSWSIPLMYGCELLYQMNDKVVKHTPLASILDPVFTAKPTKLETVSHFAIEGVMGNLKADEKIDGIVTPEIMIKYEAEHK